MSWLPTKPTPVVFDPAALKVLLFGRPKIGKSTWAASFPNALFICAEEGHGHLELTRVSVPDWNTTKEPVKRDDGVMQIGFLPLLTQLEQDPTSLPYKTFVVDTTDRLYKSCFDAVCAERGIEHPQDLKYGKGWDLIGTEFRRAMIRLTRLGRGVIFISHTKTRYVSVGEMETEKKEVSLPAKAQEVILPEVDLILRADYATHPDTGDTHRVLVADASEHQDAGSRWSLPPMFPLTKRGGYEKLLGYLKGGTVPSSAKGLKIGTIKIKLKKESNT